MRRHWAIPVIACILILGSLGLSQDVFAPKSPPPTVDSIEIKSGEISCKAKSSGGAAALFLASLLGVDPLAELLCASGSDSSDEVPTQLIDFNPNPPLDEVFVVLECDNGVNVKSKEFPIRKIGENNIKGSVSMGKGNSCSFNIVVEANPPDTTPPDNTPPETTIVSALVPDGAGNDILGDTPPIFTEFDSITFEFSGDDGTGSGVDHFVCELDGGTPFECTSPHDFTSLSDDSHTFTVRAVDAVGNVDPILSEFTWSVDTTPPETTIVGITSGSSTPGCELDGTCFIPVQVFVQVGDSVEWFNDDAVDHTVTSGNPIDGPDGIFNCGLINPGGSCVISFNEEGLFPYYDPNHPWMTGETVVVPP